MSSINKTSSTILVQHTFKVWSLSFHEFALNLLIKSLTYIGTDLYDLMPKNIADQVNVIHEHTSFMLMYSVASGQADALITEKPLALNAINNWAKDKLQIIRDVKDSERTVGMLFKKGTYESQVLYETFEQMQMDGTIKNIVHKYLPNYEFPKDLMPCNIKLAKQQSDMIEPQDL